MLLANPRTSIQFCTSGAVPSLRRRSDIHVSEGAVDVAKFFGEVFWQYTRHMANRSTYINGLRNSSPWREGGVFPCRRYVFLAMDMCKLFHIMSFVPRRVGRLSDRTFNSTTMMIPSVVNGIWMRTVPVGIILPPMPLSPGVSAIHRAASN